MNPRSPFFRRAASERGEGKLKAIVVTAILLACVYTTVKVVPPYVSEYQLADKMQETARYASVTRSNEDQIRNTIFREIQDLDIPATKEDVKVSAVNGKVSISVDYTVPIDLTVYKFDLHFTPASSNKDII